MFLPSMDSVGKNGFMVRGSVVGHIGVEVRSAGPARAYLSVHPWDKSSVESHGPMGLASLQYNGTETTLAFEVLW